MKRTYFNDLVSTVLKLKNNQQMSDFLEGILTPKELSEIATRLQIVTRLKKGITQKKIAKELRVGVATVTRGSKELQLGRFAYV